MQPQKNTAILSAVSTFHSRHGVEGCPRPDTVFDYGLTSPSTRSARSGRQACAQTGDDLFLRWLLQVVEILSSRDKDEPPPNQIVPDREHRGKSGQARPHPKRNVGVNKSTKGLSFWIKKYTQHFLCAPLPARHGEPPRSGGRPLRFVFQHPARLSLCWTFLLALLWRFGLILPFWSA